MKKLEDFLPLTQRALFDNLTKAYAGSISCKGSYILVPGKAPVMLVAHLDTVHKEPVRIICKGGNGNILMSPQGIGGDDRCGVYALVTAHRLSEFKPWLLFTCDEETGGVGAHVFCKHHAAGQFPKSLNQLKAIVEIDRNGRNDAVYYDCANEKFEQYITSKGFRTAFGSFSDISVVAPELGVAAVNLSSGYYNAHTLHEYINRRQLNDTVRKVVLIIADSTKPSFPKYEYVEARHFNYYGGLWNDRGYLYDDIYFDLAKIPESIRADYEMLLELYTPEELDMFRAENGDFMIHLLAETEFGEGYDKQS